MILQNNIINSIGNLNLESLQNSYTNKSKSFGLNLGGSGGASGSGSGSASFGINYSSSKTDRLWTDNQTSIIGTNSVTINVGNNTNIKGAIIANSTNALIGEDAIDGGNLTLNTKSLTFSNLYDHYYTENRGVGFSTNIGINNSSSGAPNNSTGQGTAPSTNPNQQNNFYPSGSTTLSLQNSSSKKEQTTFATIGNGNVNITDGSDISSLNRDVTKSQIITKDQITGALNVKTTIDNRLIAAAYDQGTRDKLAKEQEDLLNGKNLKINAVQLSELMAAVPGSPVWASRKIDERNNEIIDGKFTDHPAPNLWTGNPFDKNDEPSVGTADSQCKGNVLGCGIWVSDYAPHLQVLYYGIPGFKSFSQFHDAATTNADGTEKSGTYKFFSIFPYIPVNYYGAVGTLLDAKNWNKSSSQSNNNSN